MTHELRKRAVYVDRLRIAFAICSGLAAAMLLGLFCCVLILLLGDHAALTPIPVESAAPLPPRGDLPMMLYASNLPLSVPMVGAAVSWLIWLFLSSRLAKKAGSKGMRVSPIMSVIWHFVPVVGHAMPMLVIVEVEAATRNPAGWRELTISTLAATAWCVGRISLIGLNIAYSYLEQAQTADEYVNALIGFAFILPATIVGIWITNRFMRHMHVLQMQLITPTVKTNTEDV